MFTKAFWKRTAERVISTAAETAIATFAGSSLWDIDYGTAAGITGSAALVALLKSLASTRVGDPESPALVD